MQSARDIPADVVARWFQIGEAIRRSDLNTAAAYGGMSGDPQAMLDQAQAILRQAGLTRSIDRQFAKQFELWKERAKVGDDVPTMHNLSTFTNRHRILHSSLRWQVKQALARIHGGGQPR